MDLLKNNYRKIIPVSLLVIVVAVGFLINQNLFAEDNQIEEGLEPGQLAPDFTLTNLEGEEVSLSDYRDKYVLINFWTTWCPNCQAELPYLEDLQTNYPEQVQVLAVNYGEGQSTIKEYLTDMEFSDFMVLLDNDQTVGREYLVRGVPTNVFIDQDGTVIERVVGYMEYDNIKARFDLN
ncbi:MAG: TlpA family protein disulfide reductase [Bacillota bacterium]